MNLLIRADAGLAIGTGHVMRCLALAQAVQDAGGESSFVLAQSTPAIQARLEAEHCEVCSISCSSGSLDDAHKTIDLAKERRADWVVVDGYAFDAEYQRALKKGDVNVLFLDDYGHAGEYAADFVLNQNAHASASVYGSRGPHTRVLLGPRYAMLRREFRPWRGWKRKISLGRRVLVTMGGSDPENVAGTVIEALRSMPDIEATVLVGGSSPHFERLAQATSQFGSWLSLQKNTAKIAEWMTWADVAIAAAGSTCWEMCLLQLPMVLIDVAENQKPIARGLEALGAAIHLGSARDVTPEKIATRVAGLLASETERSQLSERCGKLVDGLGAERVLGELVRG